MTNQIIAEVSKVAGVRMVTVLAGSSEIQVLETPVSTTLVDIPVGTVLISVTGGDNIEIARALLKAKPTDVQFELVHTPLDQTLHAARPKGIMIDENEYATFTDAPKPVGRDAESVTIPQPEYFRRAVACRCKRCR